VQTSLSGGAAETLTPLSADQVRWLFAGLLVLPELYQQARGSGLDFKHFAAGGGVFDIGYGRLWGTFCRLCDRLGDRPLPGVLWMEFEADCRDGLGDAAAGVIRAVRESAVIPLAQSDQRALLTPAIATDLLRRFLTDREAAVGPRAMVASHGDNTLVDSRAALQRCLDRSPCNGSQPTVLMPSGDLQPDADGRWSTGLPWYDQAMAGGVSPGCVYGLIGPTASCKTWGLLQLTTTQASMQHLLRSKGLPHGLCVVVTYEQGADDYRFRALAQTARIPCGTLKASYCAGGRPLSTSANLQVYERELGMTEGEAERLEAASKIGDLVYILDMSGPKEIPTAGSGYVAELVSQLYGLTTATGLPIKCVSIDNARNMATRHREAFGLDCESIRRLVGDLPIRLREEVADRFACWVWVTNQMNDRANHKAPREPQHHCDAAEASEFGENCLCCFTHSDVDLDSRLIWNASKTISPTRRPQVELRFDAFANALLPADRDFVRQIRK
jgi:hypothetical protein